ncbi:hypothetical protein LJB86_01360 [Deltaproteobacteria bacterium OttesenSCG-928-M10]|nr:hypothetical protein [Deltaproteobacteria bacterium OttesenSCG-928-M10]
MIIPDLAIKAAEAVDRAGGRLLLVGGQVRDYLLMPENETASEAGAEGFQDFDLTLFGLSFDLAMKHLQPLGELQPVGRRTLSDREKELSLLHLRRAENILEISLPRRLDDSGQPEFAAGASVAEDAATRDFTINAIYLDPLTRDLTDPLAGRSDLAEGRLRLAGPGSLAADPLRLLRAMGLIARFRLQPDDELLGAARRQAPGLSRVPGDRLWPEWRKWALSPFPHLGLIFLAESGLREFWPELSGLAAASSEFGGELWTHTVKVAEILASQALPPECSRLVLTLAALLQRLNASKGPAGDAPVRPSSAEAFLANLKAPALVITAVGKLVEARLKYSGFTPAAIRRLARRLAPELTPLDFYYLAKCDFEAGGGQQRFPLSPSDFLAPLAGRNAGPAPLLSGRDILAAFPQLRPGPEVGRLLKLVMDAADEGTVKTKQEALNLTVKFFKAE